MGYALFIAAHYAELGALLLLSYIVGSVILGAFAIPEYVDKRFFYTGCGLGFVIVILFFAALFHHFDRTSLLSIALLFTVVYFVIAAFSVRGRLHPLHVGSGMMTFLRENRRLLLAATVILAPVLVNPLSPPTRPDEIAYHLPYAKFYVENHGLAVNPFLRYPLYAHNFELLYALSLLLSDDVVAHLVHAAAALLTTIGIYNLGVITASKRAGAIAALIFLSGHLVVFLMSSAYIDLGLTLFVFLTFYCVVVWSITRKDYWLYLAGFAAGIAAGTKYSGLFYIPMFALWIAYAGRKVSSVVKFFLPALIFGMPWYIRNYIISGDPISPFGGSIFGYWLWNAQDLLDQQADLLKVHGTPRNIFSFIRLPWDLLFHPDAYMEGPLPPGMFAVFPVIFLFRKFNTLYRQFSVFVFANIAIWFYSSQILRYLLPVFPVMALLSSATLLILYEKLSAAVEKRNAFLHQNRPRFPSRRALRITAAFLLVAPLLWEDGRIIDESFKHPLPVTQQMRQQYLRKKIDGYSLTVIANRNPSYPIYQMGCASAYYFARGEVMGDCFGPARYSILYGKNGQKMYSQLSSMKAKYLIVNNEISSQLKLKDDFGNYFRLIAQDSTGKLYELKDAYPLL